MLHNDLIPFTNEPKCDLCSRFSTVLKKSNMQY